MPRLFVHTAHAYTARVFVAYSTYRSKRQFWGFKKEFLKIFAFQAKAFCHGHIHPF